MDKYNIELGTQLNTSDLKDDIAKLNGKHKIKLGVDLGVDDIRKRISKYNANSNNIKVKLKATLDTDDLKRQISKLNLGSTGKGRGVAIPVNTQSLETSLKEVKGIIADIKTSMGTLDSGAGMKSLLSSINQISTALDKASGKFDELVVDLKTLSNKDFNINLGIDMNKKSLNTIGYGRAARKQVIPELEEQAKYLENMFGGQQAAVSKLAKNKNIGFDIFSDFGDFNSDSAIKKMEAMEKYINSLKKLAAIDNVNLDGFNEKFSKGASELINDITGIESAVDKAGDVPEKLKQFFGGGVNGDNLSKQLDNIVVDLGEIKTTIQGLASNNGIDGLTQSFDRLSNTLEQLMTNAKSVQNVLDSTGVNSGMSNQEKQAQETAKAYQEVANEAKKLNNISIDISDGSVNDLKNALKNLKVDDTSIENATKELNEMNIVAKSVSGTLKDGELVKWNVKGIQTTADGLERIVTITKTLGTDSWVSSEKYSQSLDKIAVAAQKVKDKLGGKVTGFNGFEQEVSEVHADVEKLKMSSQGLKDALNQLDVAFEAINTADEANDAKRLVEANKEYETALKKVYAQLKLNQQAEKDAYKSERLDLKKQNLSSEMDIWLKNNSAAAQEFGSRIKELQARINACDNESLGNLRQEFQAIKKEAQVAGKNTQTLGDKLKNQFSKYSSYLSIASLYMYAERALRSMFEQVKSIDSAMTELKKVTNETDAAYNNFLTNAATRSREIGTTIDGLVSSTADFARLGYSFEDSQGLAEVANIYAVVGDEINGVEGATESLISTMAAFKGEMDGMSNSDFAMDIIDKFNEIGKLIA